MTLRGAMAREAKPNCCANDSCIKLWVLRPSTRINTCCFPVEPSKHSVSGAKCPKREWKLIWARSGLGGLGGSGGRSIWRGSSGGSNSSSFAMKRKTLEAHLWPQWYFSLQLKHKPHSQREAKSSGDRRLRGTEVWSFGGLDNNGGGRVEEAGQAMEGEVEAIRPCQARRWSRSFSSWRRANPRGSMSSNQGTSSFMWCTKEGDTVEGKADEEEGEWVVRYGF